MLEQYKEAIEKSNIISKTDVNGIITFVLGAMIWSSWPLSGVWAIGVLVGIRIMLAGWSMIFLSSLPGQVAKVIEETGEC